MSKSIWYSVPVVVGTTNLQGKVTSVNAAANEFTLDTGIRKVTVEGDFRLNIDKGGQSQGGEDAVVVGDMANFQENCTDDAEWQLKTVSTGAEPFSARSDGDGRLWLYAGTDSAFEGRTVFFITRFSARLTQVEGM